MLQWRIALQYVNFKDMSLLCTGAGIGIDLRISIVYIYVLQGCLASLMDKSKKHCFSADKQCLSLMFLGWQTVFVTDVSRVKPWQSSDCRVLVEKHCHVTNIVFRAKPCNRYNIHSFSRKTMFVIDKHCYSTETVYITWLQGLGRIWAATLYCRPPRSLLNSMAGKNRPILFI